LRLVTLLKVFLQIWHCLIVASGTHCGTGYALGDAGVAALSGDPVGCDGAGAAGEVEEVAAGGAAAMLMW
jgi:hypothetical protein